MRTITLDDITQEGYENEQQLLISMIRTKYPKLDLRNGTVLRDLLINADAAVGAWFEEQAEEQRIASSLKLLAARADEGGVVDVDDVNAALSNFNMSSVSGTAAEGKVRVIVDTPREYTVLSGFVFTTIDNLKFEVTSDVTAVENPGAGETELHRGTASYWFLVPVKCKTVGANGNLAQGTALSTETPIYGFISAAAYRTFSGGSDLESINKTIERIPASLSVRGLLNKTAAEAVLRDRYDYGDNPIVAVSSCGYGNDAQRRDKHNLLGVAVGGRVDLYVRNFTELPTMDLTLSGSKQDDGSFSIEIPAASVPGFYCVRQVSDPTSDSISSYNYDVEYFASGTDKTWHDLDVSESPAEVCGTIWRGARLRVYDTGVTDDSHDFRVEVVAAPKIDDIQAYADSDDVRNTGSDFVVRTPMIVQMSVAASVRYNYGTPFDVESTIAKICEYVNTSGFCGRMTRSEIATICKNNGATSVDLYNEDEMLHGYVYDAFGVRRTMSGDALDVDDVRTSSGMVTKDTCVFVLEPRNVSIKTIPES